MVNIYARTFMIATLTDVEEPTGRAPLVRANGAARWLARARRWVASRGGD